jgi:hypothetical protein
MPHQWVVEPGAQIAMELQRTLLSDYDLSPRVPWSVEPQPRDLEVFDGEDIEVPLVDECGQEVAILWVTFVSNPDPEDDPYVAEIRGWRLNRGYC